MYTRYYVRRSSSIAARDSNIIRGALMIVIRFGGIIYYSNIRDPKIVLVII